MRDIAIVTGTRAEYGILKPLLEKIKNSNNLRLKLLVTGLHLLKTYGLTINEIKKDKFRISAKIPMYPNENLGDDTYYGISLANGISNFTTILSKIKPDILVVFGDRLEVLAATLAAANLRIPIAHIHGGDKTDSGHIDESIRHSITRFAHLHFTPTEICKNRLIKMGEEPWRIHNVGALNLDTILNQTLIKKEILFKKLDLKLEQRLIICLFHPVNLEKEEMGKQMGEILQAIKELNIQTVIIYPNNDLGSRAIISQIDKYRHLPFIRVFPSLLHNDYISLLNYADVLIGNSSSGIIEAPSLKLPVVNIGSRNKGREHAENVLFVAAKKSNIIKAIKKALYEEEFLIRVRRCKNPYGDGKTADRIIKILTQIKIDKKLLTKKITY